MKKISFFLLTLLPLSLLGCGPKTFLENGPEDSVSKASIGKTLKYLSSDELAGRSTGTAGIEKAAVFIEEYLKRAGIAPYFDTYRHSFPVDGVTGYNIVGYKEGTDPDLKDEFIILGAHYDHVGQAKEAGVDTIYNGANDNATGSTAVLELARQFSQIDTKRSILFTFFSAEEKGLVGAEKLAARLKEKDLEIYALLNIEMVGIPMKGKEHLAYLTGYENSNLASIINKHAGAPVVGFLPQAKKYNLFKRSDNYPFYQQFHIPAQTISSFDFTNYDFYHDVDDEYERMDLAHMERLIEALIPAIYGMANTKEEEIKLSIK